MDDSRWQQQTTLTYRPRGVEQAVWDEISGPLATLAQNLPATSETVLKTRLWHLTQYLIWAHQSGHLRTGQHVPDASSVGSFLAASSAPDGTKSSHRWVLNLIIKRSADITPPTIQRSRLAEPYSSAEVESLWRTAAAAPGARMQRIATAIVTFGLAVGAQRRDFDVLTREHIKIATRGVEVVLNSPDRVVAVHPLWAERVTRIASSAKKGQLLAGGVSVVNSHLSTINTAAELPTVHIQLARLRSTYIVDLLDRRVPLDVVLHATGLVTAGRLADYLRWTTPLSPDEVGSHLRAAHHAATATVGNLSFS